MEEDNLKRVFESEGQEVEVVINFNVPDDIPTSYANEMAIQVMHTDFVLSFFELRLPISRQPLSAHEAANAVKTVCVSRVAISAERIPDIIRILEKRFNRFMEERNTPAQQSVEETSEESK